MAYISTNTRSETGRNDAGTGLRDFFTGLANGFAAYTERRARTDQMRALNRLSDAELAHRGLSREQIPYHVFRDRFGY